MFNRLAPLSNLAALFLTLALGCARAPDPAVAALALEVEGLRGQLEIQGRALAVMVEHAEVVAGQIQECRALAIVGGPRNAFAKRVDCKGQDDWIPGSLGDQAERALYASGLCALHRLPRSHATGPTVPVLVLAP